MEDRFFKKGELDDKLIIKTLIIKTLLQAAKDYENGAIGEVSDTLAEIVVAINEFADVFTGD